MTWPLFAVGIILLFSFVIIFGAPFLPTHGARTKDIFTLLALKPGQTMLELGSGDGRILKAAAERGIRSIGYELNPLLVLYSKLITWRYRELVTVRWGNYWHVAWPETDAIYAFLLQPYMEKLNSKIIQEQKRWRVNRVRSNLLQVAGAMSKQAEPTSHGLKLVSFAFHIPSKKPTKQIKGMYLYRYR